MQISKRSLSGPGLFFASMLLGFFCLETACRIFHYGEVPQENISYIGHSHYNPFLIFGPNIDRSFPQKKGGSAYFNAQGFREKELLPLDKPAGEYRVFALGGSTTENIPNNDNSHYCGEASRMLENERFSGKVFHCVNAAKSGYSSAHTLIRLQFDLLPFKPDMITVMDQINDLTVNFFPSDGRTNYGNKYLNPVYAPPIFDLKHTFLRKSHAIVLIYNLFNDLKRIISGNRLKDGDKTVYTYMKFNPAPSKLPFKEIYRSNLKSIAQICKGHGIRLVLMTQPAVFSGERYTLTFAGDIHGVLYPQLEEFEKLFKEYNQVIRETAEEEKIDLIDMEKLLGQDPRYFTDMVHFSADGIRQFAAIYSRELKNIIPKSPAAAP